MAKKDLNKPIRIYKSAKNDILDTARKILIAEGIGRLTTDNLIEKSGLSKGGFFYHFKTIESLIYTLAEVLFQEMNDTVIDQAAKDPIKKGAHLRAYINFTFNDTADHIVLSRSLLELMLNKKFLDDFSHVFEGFLKRFYNEDVDKLTVMSTVLILDGYWYNSVLDLNFYSTKDIKKLQQHLIKQTL